MKLTTRLLDPSKAAVAIAMDNAGGEEGDWGLTITIVKEVHRGLAPGANLDQMSRSMFQTLMSAFQSLESDEITRINLFGWLRHTITQATTDSVYGPQNPFKDLNVENGFWYVRTSLDVVQKYADNQKGLRERYYDSSSWVPTECIRY